ncbi:MAG: AMP-binding protein [Sphingomonas bacterium]
MRKAASALGYHALVNGAKKVILREFEPTAVLDAIQRHRVTKTILIPAALRLVVQHPKAREADYRSLDHILYGASAMPLNLLKEAIALFDCGFIQMYGLTETTGGLTMLVPEDHVPEGSPRMLSAGKAFRDTELAIVDPQRKALPIGENGEIAIRSASNMVWAIGGKRQRRRPPSTRTAGSIRATPAILMRMAISISRTGSRT